MNRKLRISPSGIALIGSLIILIGGFFLSHNYIQEKKVYAFSYINNIFYENVHQTIVENPKDASQEEMVDSEIPNTYIGTLSLPKIGFERGFLDKRAQANNVDENITVLKESDYPDVEKGNFILAGHSGTGAIAFFNDLYKLTVGDLAQVTYLGKTYTYQLVNSYKVPKTGTIQLKRDQEKTTLTLITCTNYDDTTQTVYIFVRK